MCRTVSTVTAPSIEMLRQLVEKPRGLRNEITTNCAINKRKREKVSEWERRFFCALLVLSRIEMFIWAWLQVYAQTHRDRRTVYPAEAESTTLGFYWLRSQTPFLFSFSSFVLLASRFGTAQHSFGPLCSSCLVSSKWWSRRRRIKKEKEEKEGVAVVGRGGEIASAIRLPHWQVRLAQPLIASDTGQRCRPVASAFPVLHSTFSFHFHLLPFFLSLLDVICVLFTLCDVCVERKHFH
jgi:hypothetical protein